MYWFRGGLGRKNAVKNDVMKKIGVFAKNETMLRLGQVDTQWCILPAQPAFNLTEKVDEGWSKTCHPSIHPSINNDLPLALDREIQKFVKIKAIIETVYPTSTRSAYFGQLKFRNSVNCWRFCR